MIISKGSASYTLCCLLTMLLSVRPSASIELITEKEATLPADPSVDRGITRGPLIRVLFPPPDGGVIASPFGLRVRFEGRGAAGIDLDSVVVTYRKIPTINLTQRLRAYIRPDGIDVPDAEVPPGNHRIRVNVRDSEGRTGLAEFTFTVTK